MAKKFWNDLIAEYFENADAGDLRDYMNANLKHDIYFGVQNVKWAIIENYVLAGYKYYKSHDKEWEKAAKKFIKAARPVFMSHSSSTTSTKGYPDPEFAVRIVPQAATRKRKGTAVGAKMNMDIFKTDPYRSAMNKGWTSAVRHASKNINKAEGKAARSEGQMHFLHGDDPSRGQMGKENKSKDNRDYYVPAGNIGSRVTTVGTFGAAGMLSDDTFNNKLQNMNEYDSAALEETLGQRPKSWDQKPFLADLNPATSEMFSHHAQSAIFDYIQADLGWVAEKSKTADGKRKFDYVVEGSVGPASGQPKRFPWDMPWEGGKRTHSEMGIQDRLNEIVNDVMLEMMDTYSGPTKAKEIEASDSLGETMDSDLADVALTNIKKGLKKKSNVKVTVTRGTKKVKDNTKNSDRVKLKNNKSRARKPKIRKSNAPRPKQGKRRRVAGSAAGVAAARWGGKGAHSPMALQQLLNKALPAELMKNMTGVYPRKLENRTGRLAESAEVTSIVPFPNMTQIQYTYQKEPYQVFEVDSGSPLASGGRDPRNLIGGTIRELAQSIMGTKFGLVRTKRM